MPLTCCSSRATSFALADCLVERKVAHHLPLLVLVECHRVEIVGVPTFNAQVPLQETMLP